jgi:ABC-2 type transport system ATP-binding protein
MSETPILVAEGVTKRYRRTAVVDSVSFSLYPGEVIGFVGLNGAGKSTTINMLLGFLSSTEGTISLFGKTVTVANAAISHQSIGYATGDMSVFEDMTGRQYLTFVAEAYRLKLSQTSFESLVQRFEPQLNKKIKHLSRGNHQKIALIAAFMVNPKLIVLDEPTSGLDPLMQQRFLELVKEVAATGVTVFMSSHNMGEVADVCSRILLIKLGKLVKDISTEELEAASGKLIRISTKEPIKLPVASTLLFQDQHTLKFVYRGDIVWLQRWISLLTGVRDITIEEHSAEATYRELYDVKKEQVSA